MDPSSSDPIDHLPPLRDIIARHRLWAEKKLGQNFLLDSNITDKIARVAAPLDGVHAIEIGPGPGGLTRSLLRAGAANVTAIEFDPRAIEAQQHLADAAAGRLRLIQGDALALDLLDIVPDGPRAIIANLPYNIATPLLVGWLRQIHADPGAYRSMTLMFQREVADRITASVGANAYGRLSVLCQALCQVKRVFDIPGSAFVPPPKVTSSVVHFVPLPAAPRPSFSAIERITAAAFGQRRKMLRSSLSGFRDVLDASGIDGSLRAEQLSIESFMALATVLDASRQP